MGIALSDEQLRFVSQMPQISLDMYRVSGKSLRKISSGWFEIHGIRSH